MQKLRSRSFTTTIADHFHDYPTKTTDNENGNLLKSKTTFYNNRRILIVNVIVKN